MLKCVCFCVSFVLFFVCLFGLKKKKPKTPNKLGKIMKLMFLWKVISTQMHYFTWLLDPQSVEFCASVVICVDGF